MTDWYEVHAALIKDGWDFDAYGDIFRAAGEEDLDCIAITFDTDALANEAVLWFRNNYSGTVNVLEQDGTMVWVGTYYPIFHIDPRIEIAELKQRVAELEAMIEENKRVQR